MDVYKQLEQVIDALYKEENTEMYSTVLKIITKRLAEDLHDIYSEAETEPDLEIAVNIMKKLYSMVSKAQTFAEKHL